MAPLVASFAMPVITPEPLWARSVPGINTATARIAVTETILNEIIALSSITHRRIRACFFGSWEFFGGSAGRRFGERSGGVLVGGPFLCQPGRRRHDTCAPTASRTWMCLRLRGHWWSPASTNFAVAGDGS